MAARYLLDTNILIAALKGHPAIRTHLETTPLSSLLLSSIVLKKVLLSNVTGPVSLNLPNGYRRWGSMAIPPCTMVVSAPNSNGRGLPLGPMIYGLLPRP